MPLGEFVCFCVWAGLYIYIVCESVCEKCVNVCVYAYEEFDSLNDVCLCFREVVGLDPTFPPCVRISVCVSPDYRSVSVYRCM